MAEDKHVELRVVMPVHNGLPYLEAALESVLRDLPVDGEVVIVDDGSSDGSPAVLAAAAGRDPRVRLLRNDQAQGVSRALNQGVEAPGSSEFVAVAEHDDVVLPGRFAAQVAALRADSALGAVSSEGRYIGPGERIVGRVAVGPSSHEQFLEMKARAAEILIPHPAVTYRRTALEGVGLYDPGFDSAQDLDIINRLVYVGGWEVRMLREPGVLYRIHDANMSFSHMTLQRSITRFIQYRNRCQLEGRDAVGYEQWLVENQPDARTQRKWQRYDRGAMFYRRAGLDWISRRPVAFARHIVGAAVMHPRWVWHKVGVAAGRR